MSSRTPTTEPDLEAEREVDLGRYLDALVARWWLPLAGIIVGVVLGFLIALGGKQVFQAEATVYVGTPYGPGGNAVVQGLSTNPSTVGRIARGDETIRKVAAESGMSARQLRAGISTQEDELAARFDPLLGGRRLANYLRVLTLEVQTLARACGKSHVHNLEPEDMVALTIEASAITGIPLVGTNFAFRPESFASAVMQAMSDQTTHNDHSQTPKISH